MANFNSIDDYNPDVFELVLGEAADLIRASGFTKEHLVVIGGMVPGLLVPVLDTGSPPHVGTTDIDLCLSVALTEGDTEEYERLETVMRELGFEEGSVTFRWVRRSETAIVIEFFCPAGPSRPAGNVFRPAAATNPKAKHNFGGKLSALALDAGSLLVTDVETVTRRVVIPDKGTIDLDFRVTGPIAFIVSKLDALRQRDKTKDAYDVVWLIENWPGGPTEAAAAIAQRPAFNEETRTQLMGLVPLFGDIDQIGPASYARFVNSGAPDLDRRRAVGAIEAFCTALVDLG